MKDDVNEFVVMSSADRFELSQKANELRKAGEYERALGLYLELSKGSSDKFVAAGSLYCLRKLGRFDEALRLCSELSDEHLDFDWYKNEVIQVLLDGKLQKLDATISFDEVVKTAELIMHVNPREPWKKWFAIRRVLKGAKSRSNWNLVLTWTEFIDPEVLSTEPIKDDRGRDGWCDKAIWHNYRIRALIEVGDKEAAILLAKEAMNLFPKQAKFFARLEALANLRLGRITESERLYSGISSKWGDWWILHEYGLSLQENGKTQEALKAMCQAGQASNEHGAMVSLFFDLGCMCLELNLIEEARNHFALCKTVREQQEWAVPEILSSMLAESNSKLANVTAPHDYRSLIAACRSFWNQIVGIQRNQRIPEKKAIRRALKGKVRVNSDDKPYCFILADQESFFCSKADLPKDINPETFLEFDAVASFDKKKNRESWKAVNIRVS